VVALGSAGRGDAADGEERTTVRQTTTPVVAVDGPSGSGKSSVSRGVARALGLRYLDTGAMYRALTWAALREGIDTTDAAAVAALAARVELTSSTDPDESWIRVDGVEVTEAIREQVVTAAVSAVAAVSEARALLVEHQRRAVREAAAAGQGMVMEGRDIGSVVLPDADLKVWLVADPAVRAARRAAEDAAAGRLGGPDAIVPASVEADLARRDAADAGRAASPAARADDAVVVDATHLSLSEVVDAVLALLRERVEVRT
jgi:cytidylate kinase